MSTSFPEFVVEQAFDDGFLVLALSALVYLAVLAGAWLVWRRRLNAPVLGAALVSAAAVLVVAVVGIALFEASALWFRSERHGGRDEDVFTSARAVFFGLYAGLVLLAAGSGFVLARVRTGRAPVAAFASGLAVLGYLVVTLPFVEFLNECHVGRSFIVDAHC